MLDGTSPLSRKGELVYQAFGLGGWGEYSLVDERRAVKIDDDTPLEIACVIGCAIQTGVGAVLNTAKVQEGATLLVTGGSTGAASLSVGDNFMLSATQVINSQVGILLWSRASGSAPLFGGMLCLGSPLVRCSAVLTGGNAPPTTDCSGKLSYHFSQAYMQGQGLSAGTPVFAQYWYRDPAHADGTGVGLSDALAFTVSF